MSSGIQVTRTTIEGDPVSDLPRILRVPGTFNHKHGERRRVTLEYCDQDKRYALRKLWEMAEALPNKKSGSGRGRSRV
jgi:hypothetical protein